MRWSFKLGQVWGIKLFVHWTFLILLVWAFAMQVGAGESFAAAIERVVFILALFACVVLHEMGHARAALRYGIRTRDITLLPIGGLARLERMPREPGQELIVALAGPAVNVVIAGLILLALLALGGSVPPSNVLQYEGGFFQQLMWVNIFLVLFNLIPAFPMDGGRVLRALLARVFNYMTATTIAARVGQALAVALGIAGLMGFASPMLIFIAVFVFFGAQSEAHMVRVTDSIRGVPVHEAMTTRFRALNPAEPLHAAAHELLSSSQQDFPVTDGDRVIGVLTRGGLVRALNEQGPEVRVGDVMQPSTALLADTDELQKSYELLSEDGRSSIPVVHEGRLVGMIALENILDWMLVHRALHRTNRHAPA